MTTITNMIAIMDMIATTIMIRNQEREVLIMKMKKRFRMLISFLLVMTMLAGIMQTPVKADYPAVKPKKVFVDSSKKSVTVGSEFTLRAKFSPGYAEDDYLDWSIVSGKGVIRFEDDDRTGDDMDFIAVKKGTAKVCIKIHGTSKKAYIKVTVKAPSKTGTIKRVGPATRTVVCGNDFELEVKKSSGVSDKKLKWSIKNTKYVDFEPGEDKRGDEAEFIAWKPGTTKITCTNTTTGKSVTFTVKVVDLNDDYYDDDYDDYDDDYYHHDDHGNHDNHHNHGN